jgi:hypothetical protein
VRRLWATGIAVRGFKGNSECMYQNRGRDQTKHAPGRSMIGSVLRAMRERRWNHDRSRRIAKMLKRERATLEARAEWLEGMAIQLAEIRTLPEVAEPQR